jgi:hypothetical protein
MSSLSLYLSLSVSLSLSRSLTHAHIHTHHTLIQAILAEHKTGLPSMDTLKANFTVDFMLLSSESDLTFFSFHLCFSHPFSQYDLLSLV